jgi:CRISPR-associated endonuclease Csn1
MNKILGLDLGTNSIGWAIRNPNLNENQIIDNGVVIFKKGVGEEKGNEFPLAAERTNKRGIRRNYQVKKYQKWQLLKSLISTENSYCPLSKEDFELWYHYDKATKTRTYPKSEVFLSWLKLDFNYDGIKEYSNPYELRTRAIKEKLSNHEVGRALYHLVQRRGFLSNRKDAGEESKTIIEGSKENNRPGANSLSEQIIQEGSLGAALASLDTRFERVRNRYILRTQIEDELNKICLTQGILQTSELYKNIYKAIIWQRPLRSQKGLVGKCTFEKNKSRCPISHPQFEFFRAWSLINNIKYKRKSQSDNEFDYIPHEWKERIWKEKFQKKKDSSFDFEEVIKLLDNGKVQLYDFNYKPHQNIASSPVSSFLQDIFGEGWKSIKIDHYDLNDIWHVLFNFENEEKVLLFAIENLHLEPEKAQLFTKAWKRLPDGYGQLSLNAIGKINEYLALGFIYAEAVLYANMPKALGSDFFERNKIEIQKGVQFVFRNQNKTNDVFKIVNNLISQFQELREEDKYGYDKNYLLDEEDKGSIERQIVDFYGVKSWSKLLDDDKQKINDNVTALYLQYLQYPRGHHQKKFFKIPRLDEAVKQFLVDNFEHVTENDLDKLYHHSDNDIYVTAPVDKVSYKRYLQSPRTGSFKNPMAMRTLYELKKLINYLIDVDAIDEDDRIVVEIARNLNDANMRKAIESWQNDHKKQNDEYRKEIERHGFNPNEPENVAKVRIWSEQPVRDQDITKIRLWYEQDRISLYTGNTISFSDIFKPEKFQIEHTVPRSLSFDDSLANKTLCEVSVNAKKSNRIPTELENYDEILPRLQNWVEKIEDFKSQIEFWKRQSKVATTKDRKDFCIQHKHYNRFELEYWRNKLYRFTMLEVKGGFRNANLIDTQIISKYSFHYLKSVFKRVDVQKGEVTAIFRKIYEINEEKDRSKHTHHTIDAAVLTLIPKAKERETLLKQYFEAQERRLKFHKKPWRNFHQTQLLKLEDETLVNNSIREKAVIQTAKFVRKRGKIEYLKDKKGIFFRDNNGDKIPKIAKGDTIRGQLHNESMLGAVKLPILDSNQQPERDESGCFKYPEKEKITYVIRKQLLFGDLGFTKKEQLNAIVDPVVRTKVMDHVEKYGLNKETFKHPIWMNEEKGIRINKVRIKLDVSEPIRIRKHVFSSSKEYKKYYYAETAKGANIICAFYQYDLNGKMEREMEIVNLMDVSYLVSGGLITDRGKIRLSKLSKLGEKLEPYALLKQGTKVIFYKERLAELLELDKDKITKRLYRVLKFAGVQMTFEFHLEARSANAIAEKSKELNDKSYLTGYSNVDLDNPAPRLLLTKGKFNFAIEGKHFELNPNGSIVWKF